MRSTHRTFSTSSMSKLWFAIASFAKDALCSDSYVTKAIPRLYRIFPARLAPVQRRRSKKKHVHFTILPHSPK
jgi:hypothetical protein